MNRKQIKTYTKLKKIENMKKIEEHTVVFIPCCVIKVFSIPLSVFCGYPKSRISKRM